MVLNIKGGFKMDKKMIALNKEMIKVEDGRVFIESEDLANLIQNSDLDLFVDEEAAGIDQLEGDSRGSALICC